MPQLDWGKKEEFIQAMFRKSHSVHSRRFYEVALKKFGQFSKERGVGEVDGENVYAVLNSFVEWNDSRGIRANCLFSCWTGSMTHSGEVDITDVTSLQVI